MTQAQIRREIKKAVDQLPSDRLASLAVHGVHGASRL